MAKITVRFLSSRPGRPGQLLRWFWQPSRALRAEGWRLQRVPLDWSSHHDARQLEAAAIARAHELNAELDATRVAAVLTATRPAPPPAAGRTLGDLIRLYQADPAYTRLAGTTRRGYQQCLRKLEDWAADAPVRAIDTVRVQRLKAGLAATPAYANAVVRVLRLLLAFGRHQGWLQLNPAERPGLLETEDDSLIWPREAVDLFVATADAMGQHAMGTAVLLNEWIGQRQGDLLRMPMSVIRAGTLVLRQSKTGAAVSLPVSTVPRLKARLDAELARRAATLAARHAAAEAAGRAFVAPTTILLSDETGMPWKSDNFRHVFARVRAKLAETHPGFAIEYLLPGRDMTDPGAFTVATADLTFQALRHTMITRQAEAGSDTTLISAISGHAQTTVHQIMARYMVRTAELARVAFQSRLQAEAPAAAASTVAGGAS